MKELLSLFPENALKIIPLKDFLRITAQIGKSSLGGQQLNQDTAERLAHWRLSEIEMFSASRLDKRRKLEAKDAEKILTIYFYQWFDESPVVHVDFRSEHFSGGPVLRWKPSALRFSFSKEFKIGVRNLYAGFYLNDDSRFEKGLFGLAILNETMSENTRSEIKEVFLNNFGGARDAKVSFSLKDLRVSFEKIFKSFLKNKVTFNPEFSVLGLNLVTLYLCLENFESPLDVKASFLRVSQLFERR
jgi:hypothetical protein